MAANKKIIEDLEEIKKQLSSEIPLKVFIQSGTYEYINNMIKSLKEEDLENTFSTIGEKIKSFTKEITKPEKIDVINSFHKKFFGNDLKDQSEQSEQTIQTERSKSLSKIAENLFKYTSKPYDLKDVSELKQEPEVEREPERKQPRAKRWYYLETCDDQIKDAFAEDASFIPIIIKNVIETTDNFQGILATTITPDPTNLERYYVKVVLRRDK